MKAQHILETCIYVNDLEPARQFYAEVLGLEVLAEAPGRHVFFRHGQGVFLVFHPEATAIPGEFPPHGAIGPGHIAFKMALAEYDAWKAWLAEHGVAVEKEIEWSAAGRSIYFRDPAGNSVELTTPGTWGLPEDVGER
ncbi:MAG: VOC family protein [Candidatus Hydrogenedentes bacterium]|nr:VOC family protein [Candidatus Hydrogenedentota bacterium]